MLAVGLIRQGYDLRFEHREAHWHVFITKEIRGRGPARRAGYASAVTPWAAVQYAGWQVMKRAA